MNLLQRRLEEISAAHDTIVKLYAEQAFAALDRGDREAADAWLARIERAQRRTEERELTVRMDEALA